MRIVASCAKGAESFADQRSPCATNGYAACANRGEGRETSYANRARGGAQRDFGLQAEAPGRAFVIANERLTYVCSLMRRPPLIERQRVGGPS
jgi:hypothetical protein